MNWRDRAIDLSNSQRAGIGLFAVSVVGFVILAIMVAGRASWVVELDATVQEEVFELRSSWLNETMVWITRLGSRWVIGILLILLAIGVARTNRCRKALLVMVIAFVVNPIFEHFLKLAVDRRRPTLSQLVPGNGPSFPSGHVLASVGFYGVLAAVIWRSSNRRSIQIGGYVAATAIILLVGSSRVYLDVHWFTDVVGGMLIGTAFVIAVAWSLRGHHLGGDMGCEVASDMSAEQPVTSNQ
jgi:undecaprenyl-diphosphatase